MWVSINGLYSACLLVGVTLKELPYYFLPSHPKELLRALPFQIRLRSLRPLFFVLGKGIHNDVPFSFTSHPKSMRLLLGSARHKVDSMAFHQLLGEHTPYAPPFLFRSKGFESSWSCPGFYRGPWGPGGTEGHLQCE
ncbi:hypothetical protein LIER_31021 [Lithospermum erythrorhizon]|uniref:Uncharacterized protein n=1 Tax=Lithospermum erythrorhizon TaxID=34254 RepID=A0AAV3RRM3_LITER